MPSRQVRQITDKLDIIRSVKLIGLLQSYIYMTAIYIYIHHCAKVIGISKKRSLKGCFYSHCNFFYIEFADWWHLRHQMNWAFNIVNGHPSALKLLNYFGNAPLQFLQNICWNVNPSVLKDFPQLLLWLWLFFYLNSFDLNGPRSLQWYSNHDSVAAIP